MTSEQAHRWEHVLATLVSVLEAQASGRLILFHPSGRAALAARHGRALRPDEPLAYQQLAGHLEASGWRLSEYDDPPDRFLAIAIRP
jgi:hypothetical protein